MASLTPPQGSRSRNRRGEGDQLRRDLIDATNRLLEAGTSHEALSLRAVARAVGIAATSVYLHFPDKRALLLAVYEEHFARLAAELRAAVAEEPDPPGRLRAACLRYLRFAREHPDAYHVMFVVEGARPEPARPVTEQERPGAETVAVIAGILRECIDAGLAAPVGTFEATLCLWAALHGMTTLRWARPSVPWPPEETLVDTLLAAYLGLSTT